MASPMREKRAWSTRDTDAESQETAAFEASVAVAKDTVAKSGEFLSTAKEDLTDHHRWLRAQSAAVEADRARHERWLQRQRDQRVTAARRERARRRRKIMRQRAVRAVRHAIGAAALFVRSLVLLALAKTFAALNSAGRSIAQGTGFVGAQLGEFARRVASLCSAGARWTAATFKSFAHWMGELLVEGLASSSARTQALARAGGKSLAKGSAFVAEKTRASARVGGSVLAAQTSQLAVKARSAAKASSHALATGASLAAAKAGVVGRSAGRSLEKGLAAASAKGSVLQDATGRSSSQALAILSAKAATLAAVAKTYFEAGFAWSKTQLAASSAWSKTKMQGLAPTLYVQVTRLGRQAERYARKGAVWAEGVFQKAKAAMPAGSSLHLWSAKGSQAYRPPNDYKVEGGLSDDEEGLEPAIVLPRVGTRNALSSRDRTRNIDLSRMLIIAGVLLMVCGGLLLGGGLILRATTTQAQEDAVLPAEEEVPHGIAWTFEEPGLPLPDRAVFTLSGTPQSFRINGLSISGVNLSDATLTAVRGVVKPDVQRPNLKLALQVDQPSLAEAGEGDTEVQSLDLVPENTVPPHAAFRLVFPFPLEAMGGEDGITVEEFFESYGGLVLNFYYEIEGRQRALIQYLPPEMLRSQLDEVGAEAG